MTNYFRSSFHLRCPNQNISKPSFSGKRTHSQGHMQLVRRQICYSKSSLSGSKTLFLPSCKLPGVICSKHRISQWRTNTRGLYRKGSWSIGILIAGRLLRRKLEEGEGPGGVDSMGCLFSHRVLVMVDTLLPTIHLGAVFWIFCPPFPQHQFPSRLPKW